MVIDQRSVSQQTEVKWIGPRLTEVNVLELAQKEVTCYEQCIFGPHTIRRGSYVLVCNADAVEPDTLEGCDVAKILCLYELQDMSDKDPYRAIVQWYSRPKNVPNKSFDFDDINIDFDIEVIEEHRPYDPDISLETIFGKCGVIHSGLEISARDVLEKFKSKGSRRCPMFVCRYKFIKEKKTYRLVPLQFANQETTDRAVAQTSTKPTDPGSTKRNDEAQITRTPKRRAAFTGQKRRRASVAAHDDVEFVDMAYFHTTENKVSPIKIVGGRSVVRLSDSSAKKRANVSSHKTTEVNANYLTASPLTEKNAKVTPTSRAAAARRNLNVSLEKSAADSTSDSNYLNYSIVNTPIDAKQPNEMKIKLRLSERGRSGETDPLATEKSSDEIIAEYQRKKLGIIANSTPINADIYQTPSKRAKESGGGDVGVGGGSTAMTPSTRRKSILKSTIRRLDDGTPRRSIQLSSIVEKRIFEEDEIISTPGRASAKKMHRLRVESYDDNGSDNDEYVPVKKSAQKTPGRSRRSSVSKSGSTSVHKNDTPMTPSMKLKRIRAGEISPNLKSRQSSNGDARKSGLQLAREQLHVSVVPKSLPCRENEFENIYNFVAGKIEDQCGGCMYVSGVPGTGKTATTTSVIRELQRQAAADEIPAFEFLEINGMRLTEPRQAYVQIYKQLTGKTVSWEHAHALLEKRFNTPAPRRVTTVLLVDELDILCNRRQDVVYNLLDWPTKPAARLVVVTIANTMDLPERLLMSKVTSRLGLTRLTFQPYTHKQLQEIVTARLSGSEAFKGDAIQLVARKVAAVSGDARRALDICRRATEIADCNPPTGKVLPSSVNMSHVQKALAEMIASAKVQAIKNCSRLEQIFLQAVVSELTRTGVEETTFMGVYTQMETIAAFMGISMPTPGRALRICAKLGAERLLICEHSRNDVFQKILLNVSTDDIHYALRLNNVTNVA